MKVSTGKPIGPGNHRFWECGKSCH